MRDVVTGDDSQRVVRGTLGTLSMFGPYGSGRFLSLFRSKLDTLTIQYRDSDQGLHGVIFTMPVGTAEGIKAKLVAAGRPQASRCKGAPPRMLRLPPPLHRTRNPKRQVPRKRWMDPPSRS